MSNRFVEMDCFVLTGGEGNVERDFEPVGELTRLENSYRRYAAVFEKVFLVLKKEQATERYLNYPYVCDNQPQRASVAGVRAALAQAESEAVFIGSSDISNFPLHLAVDLVKAYNGELFLGYRHAARPEQAQPLFGVFSKKLFENLSKTDTQQQDLSELLKKVGRTLPLPPDIPAEKLGLV